MVSAGTFDVRMQAEPPYFSEEGLTLGRMRFDKQFSGSLEAVGQVEMLAARTPVEGSAGYVALERITGKLDGRRGSFVVAHLGVTNRGASSLTLLIVPDSGAGELTAISGRMEIEIVDGKHHYEIHYAL